MQKRYVVFTLLLLSYLMISSPVLGQDNTVAFSAETISLPDLPAYVMESSPTGDVVAVYAGQNAQIMLGVGFGDYDVDPSLLPIRLIDPLTGEERHRLVGGTDYAIDVAFTSTGDRLASYHPNGDIILWDIETGEMIRTIDTLPSGSGLAFAADDTALMLSISTLIPSVFLTIDTESGAITQVIHELSDSYGELHMSDRANMWNYQYSAWTLSSDGSWLAIATANDEVKLWSMDTGEQIIVSPAGDEPGRFSIRSLQFSADGSTLVYYDIGVEQTHFWSVADQIELMAIAVGDREFAMDADMEHLAWASRDGVWITDIDQPENARVILEFDEDSRSIATVAFTADGNQLIVGGFSLKDIDDGSDNILYVITLDE